MAKKWQGMAYGEPCRAPKLMSFGRTTHSGPFCGPPNRTKKILGKGKGGKKWPLLGLDQL